MNTASASLHDSLKTKLITNKITTREFLNEVLRLDQTDGLHGHAQKNEEILNNEQVSVKCSAEEPEMYFNILSITYFHLGQYVAAFENNHKDAKRYFSKSFKSCLKILQYSTKSWYSEWTNYVGSTYCYFAKDEVGLRSHLEKLKEDNVNKRIVENLLRGLSSRGKIDYTADYTAKE